MSGNCGGRKHTPIVSKKQQGLFGAEYARRKAGKEGTMSGITKKELKSHLQESGGKNLPWKKSTKGSPEMTNAELAKGYKNLGKGFPQPMDEKPHATENRGEGY